MTDNHSKTYSDMSNQRYMMRGVSAAKEDVHNAIKNIDKGIFRRHSARLSPTFWAATRKYCNIMHADGAGTKIFVGLRVLERNGRLVRMERHCARRAHHEHGRFALCGCRRQHFGVVHHRTQQKCSSRAKIISAIINGTDELACRNCQRKWV